MLILNPRQVTFNSTTWPDVTLVSIDRTATRLALDWSDDGPHPTFADVPEQRIDVKVVADLSGSSVTPPIPGDEGELSFVTSPTASDGSRRRVTMTCIITGVSHEVSLKRPGVRTIDLVAISTDGHTDPVATTEEP